MLTSKNKSRFILSQCFGQCRAALTGITDLIAVLVCFDFIFVRLRIWIKKPQQRGGDVNASRLVGLRRYELPEDFLRVWRWYFSERVCCLKACAVIKVNQQPLYPEKSSPASLPHLPQANWWPALLLSVFFPRTRHWPPRSVVIVCHLCWQLPSNNAFCPAPLSVPLSLRKAWLHTVSSLCQQKEEAGKHRYVNPEANCWKMRINQVSNKR